MCMRKDPIAKNVLPYPIYTRKPQITVLSGSQALDLEIMERDERIENICKAARRLWSQGIDPNDYGDQLFELEGIDPETLTEDEICKINHACN